MEEPQSTKTLDFQHFMEPLPKEKPNPHILMNKILLFTNTLKFATTEYVFTNPGDIVFMCWHSENIKCKIIQKTTKHQNERVFTFNHPTTCDMISGIYSIIGFEFFTISINGVIVFRKENVPEGWLYFPYNIPTGCGEILYVFKVALPLPPNSIKVEKESLQGFFNILHDTVMLEKVMLLPEPRQEVMKIIS